MDKDKEIELFNSLGEKINSINISELNQSVNSYQIDPEVIGSLSSGIYLVKLRLDGKVAGSCKIVKR
jgi:hypothetical protein